MPDTFPTTPAQPNPAVARTVNRRSIAATAAWSVPVIALSAAAPAASASVSGRIEFARASYETNGNGSITTITGTATATSGALPASVTIAYPSGFSGPTTASVNPSTGVFTVGAVRAPATVTSGTLLAAAAGYATASAQIAVVGKPIIQPSGPALAWGYTYMNGTRDINRNHAASPTDLTSQGYTRYRDVAQVGDERTYVITDDGRSLIALNAALHTVQKIGVALNSGETLAALAGGPQWIAVLTSEGRVFSSHYSVTNLTSGYERMRGTSFLKIAHFWNDGAGVVGLAANGTVWVLPATGSPTQITTTSGALTEVVDIAAGYNPRITALRADGTVWSVEAASGTSRNRAVTTMAWQVWAASEGNPLVATSLAVHSSPYTDSSYVTAAVGSDGLVWIWGERVSFQIQGASDTARFARSVDVVGALGLSGVSVRNVSVSAPVFVTLSNGRVASFGNPGDEGERGDGTSSNTTASGGESYTPSYVVDVNRKPIEGVDRVATTRGGGWAILA